MQDVDAWTLEVMVNWQSNTWTKGDDYTVGFTITGHNLHEYIDWIKVVYVVVELRPDPTGSWWHDCLWTKEETKNVTLSTAVIYVDCTLPEYNTYPRELYLIWEVNVEWQFTMDGVPYNRSDRFDNAELGPFYDPMPLSIETPPSINWALIIMITVVSVGAIGFVTYFIIRKRRRVNKTSTVEPKQMEIVEMATYE